MGEGDEIIKYNWIARRIPTITTYRLEEITGYDYFPKLEDEVEEELESAVGEE